MRYLFWFVVVSLFSFFGTTIAYESINHYVDQVESIIEDRWPSSRLVFLKALNILIEKYEWSKEEILRWIYNGVMIKFDDCGAPEKYKDQLWFSDFQRAVETIWLKLPVDDYEYSRSSRSQSVNEICVSINSDIVILNVPYMDSEYWWIQDEYPHMEDYLEEKNYRRTINLYRYHISTNSTKKALLNSDHFQIRWPPFEVEDYDRLKPMVLHRRDDYRGRYQNSDISIEIRWFGGRINDSIELWSWYGDAWCASRNTYSYNFIDNTVSLVKKCRWCAHDHEPWVSFEEIMECETDFIISDDTYPNELGEDFWKDQDSNYYSDGLTIDQLETKRLSEKFDIPIEIVDEYSCKFCVKQERIDYCDNKCVWECSYHFWFKSMKLYVCLEELPYWMTIGIPNALQRELVVDNKNQFTLEWNASKNLNKIKFTFSQNWFDAYQEYEIVAEYEVLPEESYWNINFQDLEEATVMKVDVLVNEEWKYYWEVQFNLYE